MINKWFFIFADPVRAEPVSTSWPINFTRYRYGRSFSLLLSVGRIFIVGEYFLLPTAFLLSYHRSSIKSFHVKTILTTFFPEWQGHILVYLWDRCDGLHCILRPALINGHTVESDLRCSYFGSWLLHSSDGCAVWH